MYYKYITCVKCFCDTSNYYHPKRLRECQTQRAAMGSNRTQAATLIPRHPQKRGAVQQVMTQTKTIKLPHPNNTHPTGLDFGDSLVSTNG